MRRLTLPILLLAALLTASARGGTPRRGLDSDVPEQHWAYDAIRMFAQWGLWPGFPHGTYSGKRAFTYRECATATADIAGGAAQWAEAGWPGRPDYIRRGHYYPDPLARLAREFHSEIEQLGLGGPDFEREVARFAKLWADGRPQGIETPLVAGLQRYDTAERAAGRSAAAAEWQAGEVVLWARDSFRDPSIDFARAAPVRELAGSASPGITQRSGGGCGRIHQLRPQISRGSPGCSIYGVGGGQRRGPA